MNFDCISCRGSRCMGSQCEMTDVANLEINCKTLQELNLPQEPIATAVTDNDSHESTTNDFSLQEEGEVSSPQVNDHDSGVIAKVESENEEVSAETREVEIHVDPAVSIQGEARSLTEHDVVQSQASPKETGSTFSSLLSLFSAMKTNGNSSHTPGNNAEIETHECNRSEPQNNCLNQRLACCPFGMNAEDNITETFMRIGTNDRETTVVDVSPKPKVTRGISLNGNGLVVEEQTSQIQNCDGNDLKRPKNMFENNITTFAMSPAIASKTKLKLILKGDVQLYFLRVSKTIINKVLTSKLLRWWESHHIILQDDCISSRTPSGILESPVMYSDIEDVYTVGRGEQASQLCVRLVLAEGSIILQANNPTVKDQWLLSIIWKKNMHKYRSILQNSTRPEVILKEIKNLVCSTLESPLQDDDIISVPVDIISKVLLEKEKWMDREMREEIIIALVPLLEKTAPSPEMFQFFSQHCLLHPRSPIVIDVYTSVVHRILKRTFDFGKSPYMRKFTADFMTALHSQNGGDEAIRKFILSLHGPNFECPHPRVLQNLVAVTLTAIFSYFEQKRNLLTESPNEENCFEVMQYLDRQLECCVTVFRAISDFGDWRPGLAQLLQPIPFPDDALSHDSFVEGLTPVIKTIGTDPHCEVHETILGIREDKAGWLNVYCPSGLVCRDDGELWCQMLETLISCCCRRKSFLQKMMKHLGALILVALRGHDVAQEILCLMLEWHLIVGEDQELQVVTALESTPSGREKYGELCKRQERLRQLQKKRGPRKLTLPSRSTDVDVAKLLSSGSFGNLECLSLAFTHVTSSCAHQLIQLPTLRCLNLWATHFGDAGLVIIAEHLDKLQVLNLCETPVTDKGISALAGMKNLKKLNLNSTKLSPETLETLKQKLPELQELDVRYTDAW
ncbi:UNVERIFIED_CONTAM: hypothetical protein PYX00_000901 [Menopon gallinae]|uniref:C-Maf-inducing protein PH domain-containing protein n=1 Tax=Menopon gallinae TaxID=328185 RepID=A0AAW2IAC0_9NEOP